MRSNIIKKGTADEVRCAVTELRLSETFMGVPQLSVKVVSPVTVDIEIGDYIVYDYNGVTYTLREMPGREKHARPSTYGGAFVYNLVFHGPEWDLRNAPFLDLVLYDNGQHFTSMPDVTTYEDVYGIAARVQANMDNMYPGKWEIRVVSGLSADSTLAQKLSETQDFSLSDGKCLDALSQVYSQWGVSFVYSYEGGKHVITIGGAETQEDTTGLFMYGRGNGLKVIKSSVQNASEIATRYYVYGGTQNMQPRYYNGRTMEPEYIHASDASNPTIAGICSGRRLLGDNMYVPNLMIPVSKWGRTTWYVWTASSHSQAVFTEVRNPSAGDDFAFDEPNIGASRNVISSVSSDSIVVGGVTYQYLTEVLYPDIRKAHIDAPQSYLDKYGIRPATLRFDGSGEREDIHPSIKGLTIGDIRAGLGSGAEYYPSASVYTDPDERVDEVLSCDNPQDDGLTSSGANKYESSSSIAVAAVEKEFELALSNRAGNKIYTLGGRGSYYVLSEGAQFQVQYDGVLNARIPIQFSLATEGRDDRIHCRAGVKVNKTTSSGVESVIGSSVDEKAVVDLSTIDMDLSVDISGVSVQSGDTISVDIELYTLTTKSHDKVTVNIEAFTARYNIAISLGTDFYIKLKQIGFDISEVPTNDGESPVISMTSGQCGGYEFEIHDVSYNASDDSWTLRCARVQDGTLGQWFPNSIFKIEPDDTFVLLNIALPEVYITANEQRLYDAALAERLYEERPLLEPEIDSKVMAESPQVLRAGMWFSVKDTDLGLAGADGGSFLILIDGVEVTDKPDSIRSFKVTLRNNKEDNVFMRMQRQIAQTSAAVQSERRSQTKTSVSEVPTKSGGGGEYIDTSDFVTLSTEQTITAPKTFAEDVTFGAAREDGSYSRLLIPSTSGPGIYDLYVSTEPVDGEVPSASGGIDEDELWTILSGSSTNKVIDPSHIPVIPVEKVSGLSTALSSYATKEWVEGKGYLTSVSLSTISDLHASWDSLLQSAPDFYSKGSVYSKSEADGRFVGIANEQTVTGRKTFSALLTASAGISGTNADLSGYICATKLYLPYSDGSKVYDICISTQPIDGEAPSAGGGINEDELWTILGTSGTQQIDLSRIPSIPTSKITGLDSSLSSYAKKDGSNASGTWPISISGNAASATRASYITPRQFGNQGTIGALKSSILAAMGNDSLLKYPGQSYITSGSNITTIMNNWSNDGFSIPAGSQEVFTRLDNYRSSTYGVFLVSGYSGYFYRLLRNDSSTWAGPYTLLDTGNYASTLDSRYVNVSGDTMTGKLTVDGTSIGNALDLVSENATETYLRVYMGASYKAAIGYHTTHGTYLYNRFTYTYLGLRDNGLAYRDGYVIWDAGNDGSESGLDADLLDGYQANSFLLKSGGTMTGTLTVPSLYVNSNAFIYESASHASRLTLNWASGIARIYAIDNSGSSYYDMSLGQTPGDSGALYFDASAARWGIGTTSPAYKLDVAGEIRATSGITIGSTDDYGWYISTGTRISAGISVARGVSVGSLLVSSAWADYTKVPTNGIYSKGDIITGGRLFIPSSEGNDKYYIRIE